MSSFEKSVKGATKVKVAAPKSKYVEHILIATHAGEAGIAEVFRALNNRMKDQTWTIVFKSLIVVHLMIREGEQDVTLRYLRKHPRLVAISNYSDVQEQGKNIRRYSQYLGERARSFGDVKVDFVRNGQGHLRRLSVEKGLLREVECVQTQMRALLQCNFHTGDVDNEITLTAFRMLVSDLLAFFHVVNEGVINVLEHYFEMSRFDAERALEIYKVFTRQTEDTVEFLQNARRLETATRLQIPNVKHAPTSLTKALEEYLLDPDFDVNRRQYLASQEAKKTGKKIPTADILAASKVSAATASATTPAPQAPAAAAAQQVAAPPQKQGDLIDFFASIENEQTPMFGGTPTINAQPTFAQQPVPVVAPQIQVPIMTASQFPIQQQPGFAAPGQIPQVQVPQQFLLQNPVPFSMQQPLQTDFTGAGFGGYTPAPQPNIATVPQPIIQTAPVIAPNLTASVQTPQSAQSLQPAATGSTNPFRQSMMPTGSSVASPIASTGTGGSTGAPHGTNPFARASTIPAAAPQVAPTFSSNTTDYSQNITQQVQPQVQAPLRSASTGSTNPFSRPKPETTLPSVSEASHGTNGGFAQAPGPSFQPSGGFNIAQPTGTNPFRQSKLPADLAPQIPMGGLENLETIPVFPRSDQQQNQQQPQGQGQWGGF